jgi:hypothetical protein
LIFLNGFTKDNCKTIIYPSKVADVIAYTRLYLAQQEGISLERGYERWKGDFKK